jgi:ribosome maturation factor RimP
MDLEGLVRPAVESAGLELVEVGFHQDQGPQVRRVLRVTIDREGGVDLDTIATVSERVSRRLDLEGFEPGWPYSLEVSSPGVERPLREPHEFARRLGERVRVRTARPVEGSRTLRGTIVEAGGDAVRLATDEGERVVPFEEITWARTEVDWDEELRRSARRDDKDDKADAEGGTR